MVTLACGGIAALKGVITPEQLTAFILYVEFVTTASIAVCEQYASVMEVPPAPFFPLCSIVLVITLFDVGPLVCLRLFLSRPLYVLPSFPHRRWGPRRRWWS